MRRPNHASRFEGIAKTNLQASRPSDTETLQSQVNKAAKKRLSLSELEILHGRLIQFVTLLRKVDRGQDPFLFLGREDVLLQAGELILLAVPRTFSLHFVDRFDLLRRCCCSVLVGDGCVPECSCCPFALA